MQISINKRTRLLGLADRNSRVCLPTLPPGLGTMGGWVQKIPWRLGVRSRSLARRRVGGGALATHPGWSGPVVRWKWAHGGYAGRPHSKGAKGVKRQMVHDIIEPSLLSFSFHLPHIATWALLHQSPNSLYLHIKNISSKNTNFSAG